MQYKELKFCTASYSKEHYRLIQSKTQLINKVQYSAVQYRVKKALCNFQYLRGLNTGADVFLVQSFFWLAILQIILGWQCFK